MPSPKHPITTPSAPPAIGAYTQAIQVGDMLYISGQLPLTLEGELISEPFADAVELVLDNLRAIVRAAGGGLDDAVKLNISLTDLSRFAELNEIFARRFVEPYPARAVVGVAALPKGAVIEIEAIVQVPAAARDDG